MQKRANPEKEREELDRDGVVHELVPGLDGLDGLHGESEAEAETAATHPSVSYATPTESQWWEIFFHGKEGDAGSS